MFQLKEVSENVEDKVKQISFEEAKEFTRKKTIEAGDIIKVPVPIDSFGRQIAQIVKQVLKQKIVEIQKDIIYNEFKNKVGEIVVGKVKSKAEGRYSGYYISLEPKDTEAFLPYSELIPDEIYERGDFLKAILLEVTRFQTGKRPSLFFQGLEMNLQGNC